MEPEKNNNLEKSSLRNSLRRIFKKKNKSEKAAVKEDGVEIEEFAAANFVDRVGATNDMPAEDKSSSLCAPNTNRNSHTKHDSKLFTGFTKYTNFTDDLEQGVQRFESNEVLQVGEAIDTDDDIYYKLNDGRKKLAFVFNHLTFQLRNGIKSSDRFGTEKDCVKVTQSLSRLGFTTTVHQDPTLKQIRHKLQTASQLSASEVSCLVVVVMTHGSAGGFLESSDADYPKDFLFDPFTSPHAAGLVGVPKLFFIQACRGSEMDDGYVVDTTDAKSEENKTPRHADMLVMYSTINNYTSWREYYGTCFIQEICKQLDRVPCRWNLLELLTFVCGTIAKNYRTNTYQPQDVKSVASHNKKQMPQIESTLTKLFDFSR